MILNYVGNVIILCVVRVLHVARQMVTIVLHGKDRFDLINFLFFQFTHYTVFFFEDYNLHCFYRGNFFLNANKCKKLKLCLCENVWVFLFAIESKFNCTSFAQRSFKRKFFFCSLTYTLFLYFFNNRK